MINEETIQKLIDLKLAAMALAARELANAPPGKGLTPAEILGLIVDREHVHRDNRKLARLCTDSLDISRWAWLNVRYPWYSPFC